MASLNNAELQYIGLIHKEDDSDYGVSFPDFPGCVSAGATLEEARAEAAEALLLHIEGMREDGEDLPRSSSFDQVMDDPEAKDSVAFLVHVNQQRSHAVRVNVTFEQHVLDRIDRHCEKVKITRSALLAKAAQEAISRS